MTCLPVGKLRGSLLQSLLDRHPVKDPRVVVGPRVGEDAAVIEVGDRYLVAAADPITFATAEAAWYAVQVNANDIAVRGARPRWFLATVLLPEGRATEDSVTALFDALGRACDELDVALVGGHTEVTYGLDRPIIAGTMLGEVARDRLVTTAGARVGDAVVMTKGIPLEGAALIACEREAALLERGVPPAVIRRARQFLRRPGLSVLPEAEVAAETAAVHAMHDPTEGGLVTGLLELARAADVGVEVDAQRIAVLPECRAFCEALGLDPFGLIASGALLAAVAPEDAVSLIEALGRQGIPAREIGRVTHARDGLKLRTADGLRDLPVFERDELARFFGG